MQGNGIIRGLMFLLVTLWLMGCVATSEDVRAIEGEVSRVQGQVNALQREAQRDKEISNKDVAALTAQVNALQKEAQRDKEISNKDVAALTSQLKNEWNAEIKKLQTELLFRVERNESEIRILTTGLNEYKDYATRPSKDVEHIKEDLIPRTRNLEERGKDLEERNKALQERTRDLEGRLKGMEEKIDSLTAKQAGVEKTLLALREKEGEAGPEVKSPSAPAPGVAEIYKDAYETYQRGDMEGARRKFEAFLKQYPNTTLSGNARFWIGETYYATKDYERAILEYEKVAKYPGGEKVPAALLKEGLAFLEIGDKTSGRNVLRSLTERYPQSEQAEAARKKLEALR